MNFTRVGVSLSTFASTNGTAVTVELTLPYTTKVDEVFQLLEGYSERYSIREDNRGSTAVIPSREFDTTLLPGLQPVEGREGFPPKHLGFEFFPSPKNGWAMLKDVAIGNMATAACIPPPYYKINIILCFSIL